MYPCCSHILSPLTKLTGLKGKVPWTADCQKAFDTMKSLLAQEAFLAYPDHNKPFHIYADASDLQMGAAIFQDGKPIAFYSHKLNPAQQNYTVGEKELLSIVETLKEFRSMLYGSQQIHVYTDHKNNTFQKFQTQCVLCWRLFLEDFGVQFHYIKGETNSLANALSHLPLAERQDTPVADAPGVSNTTVNSFFSMAIDNTDLLDCFVHLPAAEGIPFDLDYQSIRNAQVGDACLEALRQDKPASFVEQLLAPDVSVTCYIPEPNAPWKIYLPTNLLDNAIKWYHLALGHLGQNRLYDTIHMHFFHPDLRNKIEYIISRCDACQKQKQVLRGHGHTALHEAHAHPWRNVAVDLIGPWKLQIADIQVNFIALTIIDTVTNLVELV